MWKTKEVKTDREWMYGSMNNILDRKNKLLSTERHKSVATLVSALLKKEAE